MGKRKTTTENKFEYKTRPQTQAETEFQELGRHADFSSPIIDAYGRAERGIDNQIFESDLGEGVKDQIKNEQMFNLAASKGAALSNAAAQEHAAKTGNAATLAGMTRPDLVNTRQTQTTPFDWGGLAAAGLMGAGTALSGGMGAGGALA